MKQFIFFLLLFVQIGFSQTLRDTANQYDYVIITVPEFVNACEQFKNHKENVRNFKVMIADTSQIFAEFNSSEKPEDNIREFISYAGTYWEDPLPKYFLFAGNNDKIPNHFEEDIPEPFYTDYYYSKNINDSTKSFFTGRVPAQTTAQLVNYFNKVIGYESENTIEPWNDRSLFVSASDSDNIFRFDSISIAISEHMNSNIERKYIFRNPESPYSGTTDSIINYIRRDGASVVWFMGHSIDKRDLGLPLFLTLEDVDQFNNDKYFFEIMIGCQNFPTDTSYCITSKLITSEYGALAAFAPAGVSIFGSSVEIFKNIAQKIFDGTERTIGEVANQSLETSSYWELYHKKIFHVWGDPSIILKQNPVTGIRNNSFEPEEFLLGQNYPNPFNPSTKISFQISEIDFVSLKIYDMLGSEIAVLVNEKKSPGVYEVEFNASSLSSGIYFYTLLGTTYSSTKKMILLK